MQVLVSDTSVLIDLERGSLLATCFRLAFRFVVPDLLYERELKNKVAADEAASAFMCRSTYLCIATAQRLLQAGPSAVVAP